MQEDKFIKARDNILLQFPNLPKPFELNSDGYFFIGNLVGKIIKDLCIFYNKYELVLVKEKDTLNITDFKLAKQKVYSLYHFLGITRQDTWDYLDQICNLQGISDSMFYMLGTIEDRLKAISIYLLQKDGNWPFPGESFSDINEAKIWTDKKSQTLICTYLFELVYLLNHSAMNTKIATEYYTEALIALMKINLIFNINEDI